MRRSHFNKYFVLWDYVYRKQILSNVSLPHIDCKAYVQSVGEKLLVGEPCKQPNDTLNPASMMAFSLTHRSRILSLILSTICFFLPKATMPCASLGELYARLREEAEYSQEIQMALFIPSFYEWTHKITSSAVILFFLFVNLLICFYLFIYLWK